MGWWVSLAACCERLAGQDQPTGMDDQREHGSRMLLLDERESDGESNRALSDASPRPERSSAPPTLRRSRSPKSTSAPSASGTSPRRRTTKARGHAVTHGLLEPTTALRVVAELARPRDVEAAALVAPIRGAYERLIGPASG